MTEYADKELADLYIRFYFDEDVSVDIVANLQRRGFDALSARDANMLKRDDDAQLGFAVSQRRAFVTHNRADFEALHRQCLKAQHSHYGIIIAKRRRHDSQVVAKLLDLLNTVTADEMRGQLRYI